MRRRISPEVLATMIRNAAAPFVAMARQQSRRRARPDRDQFDEALAALNRKKPGCEMGLRHATGRPYQSFIFLLEELSRAEAD